MTARMTARKLPETDSIQELARFWDSHDLTDFQDELEDVTEPVFGRSPTTTGMPIHLHLSPSEATAVRRRAKSAGVSQDVLIREWVLQRLKPRRKTG